MGHILEFLGKSILNISKKQFFQFLACKHNSFGQQCRRSCDCHPTQAKDQICDYRTGQCKCKPGFKSRNCSEGIPFVILGKLGS